MGSLREHCFPCERANGLYGCVGYGANLFRFFYVLRTFFLAALLGAFFGAFLAPFFRLNKRRAMPVARVLRAFPVLTWFLEVRLDCLNDLRGAIRRAILRHAQALRRKERIARGRRPFIRRTLRLVLLLIRLQRFGVSGDGLIVGCLVNMRIRRLRFIIRVIPIHVVRDRVGSTSSVGDFRLVVPFSPLKLFASERDDVVRATIFGRLLLAALRFRRRFLTLLIFTVCVGRHATIVLLHVRVLHVRVNSVLRYLFLRRGHIRRASGGFLIRYHTRGRLRTRVNVEISMFVLCTFYSRVCPEFGGL